MERDIITLWAESKNMPADSEILDRLLEFTRKIHETNSQFNITGFKTPADILTELILRSIDPVWDIIVPRGTSFLDIGSGSGIPGIVLALFFPQSKGTLIESSRKKAGFLERVSGELRLENIRVVCGRAEDAAREQEQRETYDWCFARAFGKLPAVCEIGGPFLRSGGCLYVYSSQDPLSLPASLLDHAAKIGLHIMPQKKMEEAGLRNSGICFIKTERTPDKYPRKYAVIKREAERLFPGE